MFRWEVLEVPTAVDGRPVRVGSGILGRKLKLPPSGEGIFDHCKKAAEKVTSGRQAPARSTGLPAALSLSSSCIKPDINIPYLNGPQDVQSLHGCCCPLNYTICWTMWFGSSCVNSVLGSSLVVLSSLWKESLEKSVVVNIKCYFFLAAQISLNVRVIFLKAITRKRAYTDFSSHGIIVTTWGLEGGEKPKICSTLL